MKVKVTLLLLFAAFIYAGPANSQTTIILQPDSCQGKDAVIGDCVPCGYNVTNFGSANEFSAIAWTSGGSPSDIRSLMQFDLSKISATATITSATLSLYHNTIAGSGGNPSGHSQLSGSNEAWLQRITSSWTEYGVTWNTQPTITTQNEVLVPASTSSTQDYPNINVTALVQDMVSNPSQSFGFMIRLQTESFYRGLVFASSDHPNAALHPQLVVTFLDTTNEICMTSQPDNSVCSDGKDAVIGDCIPCGYYNTNFGASDEFAAVAWTNSGNASNSRSLLQFNLNNIPSNASITGASLSLYHNPNPSSGNQGHSQISGSNAAWLQRITSSWSEFGVSWATQPATTTQNEVTLSASTSSTQDYLNIDVSALVQDMVTNPTQSFGFMLRLQTESYYRSLLFASSDHANAALHPKLDVCYVVPTGLNQLSQQNIFTISPNPLTAAAIIQINAPLKNAELSIYDLLGKEILNQKVMANKTEIEKGNLTNGIYFVKVLNNDKAFVQKLVVQ